MRFSVPGFVMIKVAFFLFFICMYDKRHVNQNIYIYIYLSVCLPLIQSLTFHLLRELRHEIMFCRKLHSWRHIISAMAEIRISGSIYAQKDMFIFRHIIHMQICWNYLTFSDIYAFLRVNKHCSRVPNIDHIEMKALALHDADETAWNFWVNWSAT